MTTMSKFGHVHLTTSTWNFYNVGLVWEQWLVQWKTEMFEVPESAKKTRMQTRFEDLRAYEIRDSLAEFVYLHLSSPGQPPRLRVNLKSRYRSVKVLFQQTCISYDQSQAILLHVSKLSLNPKKLFVSGLPVFHPCRSRAMFPLNFGNIQWS